LFFLDPMTPPAPRTVLRRRRGLNGFVTGVILEREFVHRQPQTKLAVVTACPRRLRRVRSADRSATRMTPGDFCDRKVQGSKHLLAAPGREARGDSYSK